MITKQMVLWINLLRILYNRPIFRGLVPYQYAIRISKNINKLWNIWVCFLCKKPELDRRLSVDHNHKTGKIRSLLCRQCNFLVGYVENNVNLVKRILNYL